jgi:hypothetical protein
MVSNVGFHTFYDVFVFQFTCTFKTSSEKVIPLNYDRRIIAHVCPGRSGLGVRFGRVGFDFGDVFVQKLS